MDITKIQIQNNQSKINLAEMEQMARLIRAKIIELSYKAKTPHIGSSLSCTDILVAAYWQALEIDPTNPDNPNRDRFILSKGHAATALYATLAYRGFFPLDFLETYDKPGSTLPEHPSPHCAPGIEAATGSLGHGLSLGVGMALGAKIKDLDYRVYIVMSDGECNEGSVWEAALLAPAQKLVNLVAIVDYNKWQATGPSNQVMSLSPLAQKWTAFGWNTLEIDGHDLGTLSQVLSDVPDKSGKPVAVIANTIKGKGISFMENDNNWHYKIPNENEYKNALEELGF